MMCFPKEIIMLTRFLFVFLCLCFSAAYCTEIDKDKFLKMSDEHIWKIEEFKKLLTDSSDIYTYYYMIGKEAAIMECRAMLEECEIRPQSLLLSR